MHLKLTLCLSLALTLVGCAMFARGAGATRTLKGIVQRESDGAPVPGVSVTVHGIDHVPVFFRFVPAPISATNQFLRTVNTGADGRFSCTVPYYEHYYLSTSAPWQYSAPIDDEKKLTASEIVIRVKEPNKAPEPTPGAVTPRATERVSK
jgi:hypothetical protein